MISIPPIDLNTLRAMKAVARSDSTCTCGSPIARSDSSVRFGFRWRCGPAGDPPGPLRPNHAPDRGYVGVLAYNPVHGDYNKRGGMARYALGEGKNLYRNLGATVQTRRARAERKALSMPSPTDRNLTARPTKIIKPTRRRQTRHFTQLDQVTQLVAARDADPDLGFMARLLALCSLPRTNPGNQLQYVRRNGPFALVMTATGLNHNLPYGNLPRLILAWVCTEAVRTQNRKLILGESLSEFMRKVGVYSTGGGVHARLKNQMKRLFHSQVELSCEDAHGERFIASRIADSGEFWWDTKHPDQSSLWESKIELGEKFFHEIITNPIPLDLNTLKSLKRSPLGLDLYLWLVYRTFGLKRPLRLSWPVLYRQFGADPAKAGNRRTVDNFRTDCLRELEKIKDAWPDLHYQTVKGALLLSPSLPRIAPSQLRLVDAG